MRSFAPSGVATLIAFSGFWRSISVLQRHRLAQRHGRGFFRHRLQLERPLGAQRQRAEQEALAGVGMLEPAAELAAVGMQREVVDRALDAEALVEQIGLGARVLEQVAASCSW